MASALVGIVVAAPAAIDLSVIVLALMALLVCYAIFIFATLLAKVTEPVKDIPIIGGAWDIFNWVMDRVGGIINWLWENANPFKAAIGGVQWIVQHIWDPVVHFAENVFNLGVRIVTHTIPQAIGAAEHVVSQWINAAVAVVSTQIANVAHLLNATAAALTNMVLAAEAVIENYIRQLVMAEAAARAAAIAWATAYLHNLITTEDALMEQRTRSIEAALQAGIAGLAAKTAAEVAAAELAAGAAIHGLRTDAGNAIKGIEDQLGKSIVPTLTGAIGGLAALELAFQNYLKDCGQPLCNNLSGLSNELGLLLGGVALADLIALLVEATQNPGGLVTGINDVIVTPIEDVINAVLPSAA